MYTSKKPYHYGTGRRKSSVARVHLFPGGTGAITINGRDIDDYFGPVSYTHLPISLGLYKKMGYRNAGSVTFRMGKFYLFEKKL